LKADFEKHEKETDGTGGEFFFWEIGVILEKVARFIEAPARRKKVRSE